MNYRGFGLAWLAVWLFAAPAGAVPLTVGALGLDAAEVWQRGSAQEEADFDSVILRMGNGPDMLEVFLPRHRAQPKTDEAQFIEQLEMSWRRRYGQEIVMDWLEVAGKRWRICRRPSRSGDGNVYQIVTLHKGEAYQLVAVTPAEADTLPLAVQTLLSHAVWESTAGKVMPASPAPGAIPVAKQEALVLQSIAKPVEPTRPGSVMAANPATSVVQGGGVPAGMTKLMPVTSQESPAKPAASVLLVAEKQSVSEKPAPVPGKWRLMRRVMALPGSKVWSGLAEAETRLLGTDGPVTGLGLTTEANGFDGFLEGYMWRKEGDGHERRRVFRRHWRVLWPSMPELWLGGETLAVDMDIQSEVTGLESSGDMIVRYELIPVCAPRKNVIRWLDGLEANGSGEMPELDKFVCKAPANGPAATTVDVAAKDYPAAIGGKVSKRVLLPLPVEWESGIQAKEGEVRRLVLVARFQTSGAGNASGDPMFRQAAAVFVFGP